MSSFDRDIALTTLMATIMNLDTNLQILEDNKRFHQETVESERRREIYLKEILDYLKSIERK